MEMNGWEGLISESSSSSRKTVMRTAGDRSGISGVWGRAEEAGNGMAWIVWHEVGH